MTALLHYGGRAAVEGVSSEVSEKRELRLRYFEGLHCPVLVARVSHVSSHPHAGLRATFL